MSIRNWHRLYDLTKWVGRRMHKCQKWLMAHPPEGGLICHSCNKVTTVLINSEYLDFPCCNDCFEREERVHRKLRAMGW